MEWGERINILLDYIEENLAEEIDFDKITKITLCDIDVLQRFFILNTGLNLTQYIRRRRFNNAVRDLQATDKKITDIALDYGYDSSDTFCVAFKRLFGHTPSEARLSPLKIKLFPRISFSMSVTYIQETNLVIRDISKSKPFDDNFELMSLPAVRIIGKEARNGGIYGDTGPALWKEVFSSGDSNILFSLPNAANNGLCGWICDFEPETDSFIYLVCAITPAGTDVPEGFVYRDIPETICTKGVRGEDIPQTIKRAEELGYITNWEPYEWNAEFYFEEEQDDPPGKTSDTWHWMIPVKKH